MTKIGQDDVGRTYFAARYQPGCVDALPWGSDPFDCVVFLYENLPHNADLATKLAGTAADWIQIAGADAEALHDAIDRASVAIGRQRAVGDGSPMTSWHEEDTTPVQMAKVALLNFGSKDHVLILVVGNEQAWTMSVRAMQNELARQCGGRDSDSPTHPTVPADE